MQLPEVHCVPLVHALPFGDPVHATLTASVARTMASPLVFEPLLFKAHAYRVVLAPQVEGAVHLKSHSTWPDETDLAPVCVISARL